MVLVGNGPKVLYIEDTKDCCDEDESKENFIHLMILLCQDFISSKLSGSSLQKVQRDIFDSCASQVIRKIIILFLVSHLQSCSFQLFHQHSSKLHSIDAPLPHRLHESRLGDFHLQVTLSNVVQAVDRRVVVSSLAHRILTNVAGLLHSDQPFVSLNVVKIDILARITNVATDCVRIQQTFMNFDVLEGDVGHCDSGLSLTSPQRIQHASWPISIRFLHLLRTNVDGPPNRPVHRDILIQYVFDQPSSLVSRIALDVDPLQRPDHLDIPKSHVLNAVAAKFWRNASYGHPHAKSNCAVLDKKITSAVSLRFRLRHNYVIVILAGDVVYVEPGTSRIDPICVEWKHGNHPLNAEFFDQVNLSCGVNFNVNVIDLTIMALIQFEVKLGSIFPDHVVNFSEIRINHVNEVRSEVLVCQVFVGFQKGQNPPMIAPSIDLPSPFHLNIGAVPERNKIFIVLTIRLPRPMGHIF